jgi:hypothetical protein
VTQSDEEDFALLVDLAEHYLGTELLDQLGHDLALLRGAQATLRCSLAMMQQLHERYPDDSDLIVLHTGTGLLGMRRAVDRLLQ